MNLIQYIVIISLRGLDSRKCKSKTVGCESKKAEDRYNTSR